MIRSGERDLIAGRDKDFGARQDRGDKTRKKQKKIAAHGDKRTKGSDRVVIEQGKKEYALYSPGDCPGQSWRRETRLCSSCSGSHCCSTL